MYFLDYYYFIWVLPAMVLMIIAQISVKTTFSKYSKKACNVTGAEAARQVLQVNGVSGVKIERVSGNLTDHFDPRANVIRLSDAVYDSNSVAAAGVAAHEAGHAVQHATNYAPIVIRQAIIPVCQFGSNLAIPLVLAGLLFSFYPLAYAGIILFGAAVFFQLVTLPVEFNASSRAVQALDESGVLSDGGLRASKKVLRAAALTYVAALFVSLANMLRLVLLVSGRRRND